MVFYSESFKGLFRLRKTCRNIPQKKLLKLEAPDPAIHINDYATPLTANKQLQIINIGTKQEIQKKCRINNVRSIIVN